MSEYIERVTLTDTAPAETEVLAEAAAAVDAAADSADLATTTPTEGGQLPVIKVLKGNPTDEEIAVLVAVLAAAASVEPPADTTPPERWGAPTAMHRARMPFSPYAFLNRT